MMGHQPTERRAAAFMLGGSLREVSAENPVESDFYFEDFVEGNIYELGKVRIEEEDILDFARRFDPQPFHTDPEVAKESVYGGLIASGWHTASLMMRIFVDNYLSPGASLGSPGVDELRWLRPVRPGDVLSVRVTVMETRRSRSKPDRGLVRSFAEVINQDAEVVMTLKGMNIFRCRESV
jgi:acyl dehydratase